MSAQANRSLWLGLGFGFLGVLIFSFTFPATRMAVTAFSGIFVGLGRAIVAGVLAALILAIRREPLPAREHWPSLFAVIAGVIIGFPVLSSIALQTLPASHGAVINGLLPAMTAFVGALRTGERPPAAFWMSVFVGMAAVLIFAAVEGAGHLQAGDLLLLGAVAVGAVGYVEGGKLARVMGGWRTICWALVFALPLLILPAILSFAAMPVKPITPTALFGFAYVSVMSMLVGFFAWYFALAVGGIARVSQVQLLQPVLTIIWSALVLGERLKPETMIAALFVIIAVMLTQWSLRRYREQYTAPTKVAMKKTVT